MIKLEDMGKLAVIAQKELKKVSSNLLKQNAINAIADILEENINLIISENNKDLAQGKANGLSDSLLDRLKLDEARIISMANSCREVARFLDPIGKVVDGFVHPNGMKINKVTVPIGVIGMIYEARPNVTVDASVLCLKAGNCVILRGGKEAINSNIVLSNLMRKAIKNSNLDENCIQLITDTSRESANELMNLTDYLDVLIPRGGSGLINAVVKNAHVPVIETGAGNCHTYIDEFANLQMGVDIVFNAKTSRPSVCNAMEKLLVHKSVANEFLPLVAKKLSEKNVELRCDSFSKEILKDFNSVIDATNEDWETEYGDYILAIKVVDSIDDAIAHISKYSTKHSEAIVTDNYQNSIKFTDEVDCAGVYINASTRFTDGGEFGLGAEIGISTQKLHARGPMGINQLTSTKYIISGNGNIRV